MNSSNPYEAPRATVNDLLVADDEDLLPEPRSVPAANGWQWIVSAWELLKADPGTWIVLVLLVFGVTFAVQLVPLVGALGQQFVTPFSSAAVAALGDMLRRGNSNGISGVIERVTPQAGQIAIVGAIMAGVSIVLAIVIFVPLIFSLRGGKTQPVLLGGLIIGASLIVVIPLVMATYFAPALICLHGKPALEAISLSFRACLRNIPAFLVFFLCCLILAIGATLPIFLGWFVLIPLMFITTYAAYRDIFFEA